MRIHLIAIGGSAMHNFALALDHAGHEVTGSDDQIFEPSRSRLDAVGLLPSKEGWFPNNIDVNIDVVILGMHARSDNPELLRAKELGVSIQSYPEFLFNSTINKKRVVIGGSHGKTTITSMILHVLKHVGIEPDYMVGAQLDGFDRMLELNAKNQIAIIEGDEYLSSPIDRRSKFLHYKPHIAILTGISWDHINVFPTEKDYLETFREFISTIELDGVLVFCKEDLQLTSLIEDSKKLRSDIKFYSYSTPKSTPTEHGSTLEYNDNTITQTQLVGSHNFQNLAGAREVCKHLGVSSTEFDKAIINFSGASRRLEIVVDKPGYTVFRDFAHAPSKLRATQAGVVGSFPNREVTAVFELHTFSSLNKTFLPQYRGSMDSVDHAIVYYDPKVVEHKRLPELTVAFVKKAFGRENLEVITSKTMLRDRLAEIPSENHCVLIMSSGRFSGVEMPQ